MNKTIIELTDSERLVLFEFLSRIIDDEYDKYRGFLFDDISEEEVLCIIKCQLEKIMVEPNYSNYHEILLTAREEIRKKYGQ
ncbi:MAG: hypothetical protein J6M65_00555 [Eubacterium sp.]|nr:hypothetical protein [Eubacterium sp.]